MLVFAFSCGKGPESSGIDLPKDSVTAAEKLKIQTATARIEADLKEAGVSIKLDTVPVIVSDFGDHVTMGRCYQDSKGTPIAIVLSHAVLSFDAPDEDFEPWYLTVLLHEIGHCYFNREHEDDMIYPNGQMIFGKLAAHSREQGWGALNPSVMNTSGERNLLKVLRAYYVKEIAGLDRAHSWEHFAEYTPITLRAYDQSSRY